MEEQVMGLRRSPTIGKLIDALQKAQAAMKPPAKSKTAKVPTKAGGEYSYKYADLAAVKEAYQKPLTDNGLAVAHSFAFTDGHLLLATTLLHTSGEWMASDLPVASYDKPQEQGSAFTYYKRYNVCALLDIVAEDDDDGAAAQAGKKSDPRPQAPATGDAAVILDLAPKLAQAGESDEDVIRRFSSFPTENGPKSFSDPRKVGSSKWLKGVREKMERAYRETAGDEPGAAEAAAAFTEGLTSCPQCGANHPPSAKCAKGAAA